MAILLGVDYGVIQRKKAPPIPYEVTLVSPSGPSQDMRIYIEDWRLEIDFRRQVAASLWLEIKGDLTMDPIRDLVHVAGGDATRVDITFKPVMPERVYGKWQLTLYEVDAWTRANTIPLKP